MFSFLFNNPKISVSTNGLHPFVFKSFLLMQFWNTWNTIIDFLTTRIPTTTAFTSFCVSLGPETFYRYIVAGVYFTFNNAQFFTALFCAMRVLILYTLTNQTQLCRRLFIAWSLSTYAVSFTDAAPIVFYPILCLQMNSPFQDGAIAISSAFMFGNNAMNMLHFAFSTVVILIILITTGLVIIKLRSQTKKKTSSRSQQKTRAETTLTVTMILIIIPSFLAQGLTIASLAKSPYYSYILSVRPLMLDLRVHVVSIYFYLTHPIFKARKGSNVPSTVVKSVASSMYG
uniref:Serpentine Receptor, class T n=1 Tax=Caenorhabditis tropicalis TaxID=1561998 RepID=A0A1I7U9M4_9PELO